MFSCLPRKYSFYAMNACFLSYTLYHQKNKLLHSTSSQSNIFPPKFPPQENKQNDDELSEGNKNKLNQKIKEFRAASLFEDYADILSFNDYLQKSEANLTSEGKKLTRLVEKKEYEEISVVIGDGKTIPNRTYIQVDVYKLKKEIEKNIKENKSGIYNLGKETIISDDQLYLNQPQNYFQKILVCNINNQYYAVGSFCGYDLADLREGVLLGNKLICPKCLSEYNVENGWSESGPNNKFLATFPVSLRDNRLIIKIPENQIPLFSYGPIVNVANPLDPRHIVIIGDNETTVGCIDNLIRTFTGKISVVTHQTDNEFIDKNKILKSFFPIKVKQSKFLDRAFFDFFKINIYDEKVVAIDGLKRMIQLSSGNKLPFDKVLVAVGSKRVGMEAKNSNCFQLNTIRDHAAIHNEIIKPEVNSIAIVGNSERTIDIASSLRRYLDAIQKEKTKVFIVCPDKNWFLQDYLVNEDCLRMIQDYLARNRIYLFRGASSAGFIEDSNSHKTKAIRLIGEEYVYNLPADVFILDNKELLSNCDFIKKIRVSNDVEQEFGQAYSNVIIPDERMSLHPGHKYPFVFTAGSCSATQNDIMKGVIRTDNMKANYHMGYMAALNMLEVHYPYDDVVVNSTKVLDRDLHFIGNDHNKGKWNKSVTHMDKKKDRFITYLFINNTLDSVVMYGFSRAHILMRESLRMKLTPDFNYASNNKDSLHDIISLGTYKASELIECFRHRALISTRDVSTLKYSNEDQLYMKDLSQRVGSAYEDESKKLNKESIKKMEEKKSKKKSNSSAL